MNLHTLVLNILHRVLLRLEYDCAATNPYQADTGPDPKGDCHPIAPAWLQRSCEIGILA